MKTLRAKSSKRRDPDLVAAEAALVRAGEKAREAAQRSGGHVVVWRDGRIVKERPGVATSPTVRKRAK